MIRLALRPLAGDDIPLMAEWLTRPHIRRWFGQPQSWLDEIHGRDGAFAFIRHFILLGDGLPIGFSQYYDCSQTKDPAPWSREPAGTCGIDFLLAPPELLGRGLGTKLVGLTGLRAAAEQPVRRLISDPDPDNIPSIRALAANGYTLDAATGLYKKQLSAP
ncbi:MAG: acetyltransferase [Methylobacteriaceae bacterium]|jgi:RimJ/RimL family protein N-acetyltransferase|nr:acetyltransferase [Methylobacteriaceae bacterium]